ncbi:hypothetical protein GOV12_00835 [Candidatus Pacearchaeota archaeon]|nr:hypothetical protein [Candidatus Pacearchaeota archaeon]
MVILESSNVNEKITGFATEISTVSNVTIQSFLSIDMSTNLSEGIQYGNVASLPAYNVNSTHNYDNQGGVENLSSMFINVSIDSNTAVDLCLKADDDLNDSAGGNIIGITNMTYANNTYNNLTLPNMTTDNSLALDTYEKGTVDLPKGNSSFFRFWLDVPASTVAGSYNNSIYFKGVQNGSACGS